MARGRPKTYDKSFHPDFFFEKYTEGATDFEAAKHAGIALCTLYQWKNKYPELADAIKRGKDVVDTQVEASLLKRAKGYQQPDTHIGTWQGEAVVTPIIKHIPPDPTSMIFWLKNRKPKEWRDKIDTNVNLEAGDTLASLIADIRTKK